MIASVIGGAALLAAVPIPSGRFEPAAFISGDAQAQGAAPPPTTPPSDQAVPPPPQAVPQSPAAPPLPQSAPPPPSNADVPGVPQPAATTPAAPAPTQAQSGQPPSDVTVTTRPFTPGDPLESMNVKSFEFTQKIDDAVIGPVSVGYTHAIPKPARNGISNLLFNLHEPVYFGNYILQHKIGKAAETVARFVINSTIGVAGLFDIAKRRPFRLPRRENGFANTLAFYGVKNGAFLFLPIYGPTTVRDLFGNIVDLLPVPLIVGSPFNTPEYNVPATVLRSLDRRAAFDETLRQMRLTKKDLYTARRDYYLQTRQAEIDALHAKRRQAPKPEPTTTTPPPTATPHP